MAAVFKSDDVIERVQDFSIPYLFEHHHGDSYRMHAVYDYFTTGITAQHTSISYTIADTDRDVQTD